MLIVVDKPSWISSFDVIRVLKRELSEKKIWHSGTLDPLATGLMLIWTWDDTKKLNDLIWLDKTYETMIDFSKKSDTRDMWYRDYYEEIDVKWKEIPLEDIKSKLDLLIPEYELPLTPFSAKKKDWKKLYDLARKWELIIIVFIFFFFFWLGWILTMLRRIRVGEYKLDEINLDKEWTFFRKEWEDISFKYWIVW